MKRIALFLLTNLAVLVVLSVVLRVLGLDRAVAAEGVSYGQLLAFSAVVGFRFHRSARLKRPLSGHHSHRPVSDDISIATPIQPTIWRPAPGTISDP